MVLKGAAVAKQIKLLDFKNIRLLISKLKQNRKITDWYQVISLFHFSFYTKIGLLVELFMLRT